MSLETGLIPSPRLLVGLGSVALYTAVIGAIAGAVRRRLPVSGFTLLVAGSLCVGAIGAGYLMAPSLIRMYALGGFVVLVLATTVAVLYTMARIALSDI